MEVHPFCMLCACHIFDHDGMLGACISFRCCVAKVSDESRRFERAGRHYVVMERQLLQTAMPSLLPKHDTLGPEPEPEPEREREREKGWVNELSCSVAVLEVALAEAAQCHETLDKPLAAVTLLASDPPSTPHLTMTHQYDSSRIGWAGYHHQ